MALLSETVTVVNVSTDEYPSGFGMAVTTQPDLKSGSIVFEYSDGTRLIRKVAYTDLVQYTLGQTLTYGLS